MTLDSRQPRSIGQQTKSHRLYSKASATGFWITIRVWNKTRIHVQANPWSWAKQKAIQNSAEGTGQLGKAFCCSIWSIGSP